MRCNYIKEKLWAAKDVQKMDGAFIKQWITAKKVHIITWKKTNERRTKMNYWAHIYYLIYGEW